MSRFRTAIASCVLIAAAAPGLRADDVPMIRLSVDQSTHALQVQSFVRASVFLALGVQSIPPIRIAGIDLDVVPQYVLSLGIFAAGETMSLVVPRGLRGLLALHAEAVAFDLEVGALRDSNVVAVLDAFHDLVDATFRAGLEIVDGKPAHYRVAAALTAPTSAFELKVDSAERNGQTTNVYLRLMEPGEKEIVLPVLSDHAVALDLEKKAVDKEIHVYLMRVQRGSVGPQVYQRMAELAVPGAN